MVELSEADFARNCSYLARLISGWAGDSLTLPERLHAAMSVETVARFTDDVRGHLDRLDKLAGRAEASRAGAVTEAAGPFTIRIVGEMLDEEGDYYGVTLAGGIEAVREIGRFYGKTVVVSESPALARAEQPE